MKGNVLRAVEPVPQGDTEVQPLRIDIGCGRTTPPGWIGIDAMDFGQAWLANIARAGKWTLFAKALPSFGIPPAIYGRDDRLPLTHEHAPFHLADNSVDEVRSSHFVEHLTGLERVAFFNELWRVMKPGATALIVTPNWQHSCAYGDPTHQWPPMSQWYPLYLHKAWREVNAPHAAFTCDFDHVIAGSWDGSLETRSAEYKQFAMNHYTNAWRDLIVTLTRRA